MSGLIAFRTTGEDEGEIRPADGRRDLQNDARMPRLCLIIFLALVLPLGIILAFVTPLGGVADETAHALRAESLSHGEIIGYRAIIQLPDGSPRRAAGVSADLGIVAAAMVQGPGEWVTPARLHEAHRARWQGHLSFAEITPLALYMPIFYAPAAIAMAAMRAIHAGPAEAYLSGRLINLFVFALIGMLALSIARRGHAVLLCTLALPMEISLAASLNQDGLLIATAVLAVALLTREEEQVLALFGRRRPSPDWIAAAGLLGVIALAKIPYVGLLLMLVFPIRTRRDCGLRLVLAALCAVPALGWAGYAMSQIATPWPPLPLYRAGPFWPGPAVRFFTSPDAAAQMLVLAADPLRVLTLTLRSLWLQKGIVLEFIGVLGFVSLRLPAPLYALWALALLSALLADRQQTRPSGFGRRDQFVLFTMLGLITVAIYMSQYLTWTKVGFPIVQGPTGRYFLPLLPATAFLVPRARLLDAAPPSLLLLPVAAAAMASLIVTPLCVLDGFYAP
ncbi:DUF2142 domain-containing protein [Acidisoma cellulosilytica]|uniref:DUF2142 domain-containing protein n=1 Tax=Acidisoma cellulosilyticum TaxID=2802395 RepID=A0A964E4J9_9PROT|nr:DUF2142 domain-containing protein [Acidisoma cellulosilyticum]MCB8881551.1 DUF2142 domain-containing protein [Acidisoma cellulosilyticum]